MTTTGPELLKAIHAIRDFFGDVSQLLLTAQSLMAEQGWEAGGGAGCLFGQSYSIYEGRQWMPRFAVRWFTNPETAPGVLASISVQLDAFDDKGKLDEPVVAAGYFVLNAGQTELENWHSCWYCWRGKAADGGTYIIAADDLKRKSKWGWQIHEGFAQSLVAITNQESLTHLIVEPLLSLLSNRKEIVSGPQEPEVPPNLCPQGDAP